MNADARTSTHGPGLFAAFVPWIVFWMLVGNVDLRLACLIPLGIVALQTIRTVQAGAAPKVLEGPHSHRRRHSDGDRLGRRRRRGLPRALVPADLQRGAA